MFISFHVYQLTGDYRDIQLSKEAVHGCKGAAGDGEEEPAGLVLLSVRLGLAHGIYLYSQCSIGKRCITS